MHVQNRAAIFQTPFVRGREHFHDAHFAHRIVRRVWTELASRLHSPVHGRIAGEYRARLDQLPFDFRPRRDIITRNRSRRGVWLRPQRHETVDFGGHFTSVPSSRSDFFGELRRANDCSRRGRGGGEHVLSLCDVRRYPKLEAEKERYRKYDERDIFREKERERERNRKHFSDAGGDYVFLIRIRARLQILITRDVVVVTRAPLLPFLRVPTFLRRHFHLGSVFRHPLFLEPIHGYFPSVVVGVYGFVVQVSFRVGDVEVTVDE